MFEALTSIPAEDPAELPRQWKARAAALRRYGAEGQAVTLEMVAAELEATLHAAANTLLTVSEAAEASGYSARRLRELIGNGTIPAANEAGPTRVRRGDLPRRQLRISPAGYDPQKDAAALAKKMLA